MIRWPGRSRINARTTRTPASAATSASFGRRSGTSRPRSIPATSGVIVMIKKAADAGTRHTHTLRTATCDSHHCEFRRERHEWPEQGAGCDDDASGGGPADVGLRGPGPRGRHAGASSGEAGVARRRPDRNHMSSRDRSSSLSDHVGQQSHETARHECEDPPDPSRGRVASDRQDDPHRYDHRDGADENPGPRASEAHQDGRSGGAVEEVDPSHERRDRVGPADQHRKAAGIGHQHGGGTQKQADRGLKHHRPQRHAGFSCRVRGLGGDVEDRVTDKTDGQRGQRTGDHRIARRRPDLADADHVGNRTCHGDVTHAGRE